LLFADLNQMDGAVYGWQDRLLVLLLWSPVR
jgi:hypothetical protein